MHKYTPDEQDFFAGYTQGHTYKEIQAAFTERFGWEITLSQVKGYMGNHRMNNGLTGRFKKGQVSHNKGKKGVCAAGCEKGWFQKGHTPKNHKPVGSERVSKDGYVEVKVSEPNKWKPKHKVIWEQHNGPIPAGKCIIFLNGDKADVRIDNLMLIDRKVNVRMNQTGLRYDDPDITKSAVNIAELMTAIGEAKRKKKDKKM